MLSVRKDGQVGHLQSNSIPRASFLTCFPDLDTKWQRSREHLTERGTIRGLILHLQLAMTPREQVYRDENSTALVTGLAIDLSHHQRGLWAATIVRANERRSNPYQHGLCSFARRHGPDDRDVHLLRRVAGERAFASHLTPSAVLRGSAGERTISHRRLLCSFARNLLQPNHPGDEASEADCGWHSDPSSGSRQGPLRREFR